MKKLFITAMFLLTLPLSVSAANGDIIGNIYSTDIRAYINGVEVQSYNIGGKTAVVIEDILDNTQYTYNDKTRSLEFYSLKPESLVEHNAETTTTSGNIVGNIYETDIKTSIYNVVLPSYNIGGKTAVVLEDLGDNEAFSAIGGKFFWNNTERVIKLDFLYDNSDILSYNKRIIITPNENLTEAEATFEEVIHCKGYKIFNFSYDNNTPINFPIKAKTDNDDYEIIGYHFRIPLGNAIFTDFTYFYPEQLEKAVLIYTPAEKTKESIIEHFQTAHYSSLIERIDTDKYSFAWLCLAYTSGSENYLVQAYDDGTYRDYLEGIRNSKRSIQDFEIDKENEKIRFKYVDRYTSEWFTNYEIDLKAGTMKEI